MTRNENVSISGVTQLHLRKGRAAEKNFMRRRSVA